jgi:hypothetical protein
MIAGLPALVILAATLSACTPMNSAAQIGDQTISINTVQRSIDEILQQRTKYPSNTNNLETGANLNQSQLRFQLVSLILSDIAREKGITIKPAEIAAKRAQIISQIGGEANLPQALVGQQIAPRDFDLWLHSILIFEKLGGTNTNTVLPMLVKEFTSTHPVTINPQFGKWDINAANIVADNALNGAVQIAPTR